MEPAPRAIPVTPSLAIALSGGGHRATLFGLGALMYLVDAGRQRDTTSIASVSGGSLANGFLAQTLDFRKTDSAAFDEKVVAPVARQIALRGTLFASRLTKFYLMCLVAGFAVVFLPWWLSWEAPWWLRLLLSLGLLLFWGWLLRQRGWVCAQAFKTTLFSPTGPPTRLGDIAKNPSHVLCATEIRTAESLYFAGDFVYCFTFGPGLPGDMPLYRAVQASAAFPGGFPPARLPTRTLGFKGRPRRGPDGIPSHLVLTDGGVYDNMGDQWARGFSNRATLWPELGLDKPAPNRLVVVNASARVPWVPFRLGRIPFVSELAAFFRVTDIMYVNTTNVRRQDIVQSFDPLAPMRLGHVPGALVQIAQSPFDVAGSFANIEGNPIRVRARAVIGALGEENRAGWKTIALENSSVATTLSKLGTEVSARLLYQGYVVAMCNLHVLFGTGDGPNGDWPLFKIPTLERFTMLAR